VSPDGADGPAMLAPGARRGVGRATPGPRPAPPQPLPHRPLETVNRQCHFTPDSAIRSPETGHTAGGWETPFAVITGYPTAGEIPAPRDALEVQHGPSGSDWPSIPKAGTNGDQW